MKINIYNKIKENLNKSINGTIEDTIKTAFHYDDSVILDVRESMLKSEECDTMVGLVLEEENESSESLERKRRKLEKKAKELAEREATIKAKEKHIEEELSKIKEAEENLRKKEAKLSDIEIQKDPDYDLVG